MHTIASVKCYIYIHISYQILSKSNSIDELSRDSMDALEEETVNAETTALDDKRETNFIQDKCDEYGQCHIDDEDKRTNFFTTGDCNES
jgi:hypothetical protein